MVITDYIKFDSDIDRGNKQKVDNMLGLIGDYGMAKSMVKKSFLQAMVAPAFVTASIFAFVTLFPFQASAA